MGLLGQRESNSMEPEGSAKSRPLFQPQKATPMDSVLDAVGNTPLVRLRNVERKLELQCEVWGKCEFLNPGGSVKDRIGLRMVEDAEKSGRIKPGDTLIEPTSGNTGIGIALAAAVKGYKCIIVMPEKMSKEKSDVLRALGTQIVRTPTEAAFDAPESHISVATRLNKEIPNSCILDQYENLGNPQVHFDTTGTEILEALGGRLDMLVAGAGTGGTITGVAKRLKEHDPTITIVGVDPVGSILAQPSSLNDLDESVTNLLEGIGYDFIPAVLQRQYVDKWVKTNDADSFKMSRFLIREEGLLCGGSSGAAMCGVKSMAKDLKEGQRCVVILPDNVRNYMTKFLSDEWMVDHGMLKDVEFDESEVKGEHSECWLETVGSMTLPTPHSVSPSMTCSEVIKLMKDEGFDQLPVVDDKGEVQGIITESQLLFELRNHPDDFTQALAAKFCFKKFAEVSLTTKLWELSRILDRQPFVLVVAVQRVFNDSKQVVDKKMVLSILTRIDLLNHMLERVEMLPKHLTRASSQLDCANAD